MLRPAARRWGVQWVRDHLDAINDPSNGMDGIPLVLQEFNLSRWENEPVYNPKICANTPERKQMFQGVRSACHEDAICV
jgi:hypothetical protein